MINKRLKTLSILTLIQMTIVFANSGALNVGFDIDDTILFSRDVFLNIPKDKETPLITGGSISKIGRHRFILHLL